MSDARVRRAGLAATTGAFLLWGLFPLYWKMLDQLPALEIMAHRLLWCFGFVVIYLLIARGRNWLAPILHNRKLLLMLTLSSLLIGCNWFLYVWAVNNEHIVETSLGYFINPLINILLAVLVLRERLNRLQWLSVSIAGLGVAWLTLQVGRLPWIALTLACSFGLYGLLRKLAEVDSIPGLAYESGLLVLPSLLYLAWLGPGGSFGTVDPPTTLWLILAGPATAAPLILFAYGARRIPYSTVGIIQYMAPSLQLMVAVFVFGEPFTSSHAVGFGCIWLALALYAGDAIWRLRRLAPRG